MREGLVRWLGRFTPFISVEPPQGLLLEVRGSLKLFGGLDRLQDLLRRGLAARGHGPLMACAPTALASLWLARAGRQAQVLTLAGLRHALAPIPVRHLGWPDSTCRALGQMGIIRLGDCLPLPRAGLAHRFGPGFLGELDQALGRVPELRRPHVLPLRFTDSLDFPDETADTGCLLQGFRVLADRLQSCLQSRQVAVRTAWCSFRHGHGQTTRVPIRLRQASAEVGLLLGILQLHLEAGAVQAAVTGLRLDASLVAGFPGRGTDLLGEPLRPDGGLPGLLERLRARFGSGSVYGLALEPEHRPERAWRQVMDPLAVTDATARGGCRASRPLWLLPAPRPLPMRQGLPSLGGTLCIEQGPERIETGWWDGADMRRDYYRAGNRQGGCFWLFHDLRGGAWYLHGVF